MARQPNVISHWSHLYENFQTPSSDFYRSVEAAVLARSVPEAQAARIEHEEGGLASANRMYLRIQRGKHAFDVCAAPFGNGYFFSWWLTQPPLRFGILYTFGFFFLLTVAMNIAFGIGAAMGAPSGSIFVATFLGCCAAFLGVPFFLWLIGNGMRQGKIPGEPTVLAMPLVGLLYELVFAPPTFYSVDTALMFQESVSRAVHEVIQCVTTEKGVRALTEAERKPIMMKFGPNA